MYILFCIIRKISCKFWFKILRSSYKIWFLKFWAIFWKYWVNTLYFRRKIFFHIYWIKINFQVVLSKLLLSFKIVTKTPSVILVENNYYIDYFTWGIIHQEIILMKQEKFTCKHSISYYWLYLLIPHLFHIKLQWWYYIRKF